MGVDLGDLAVKTEITLESLSGKVIAIDAFNMLYQFLASIRQEDGTPLMDFSGNITAHLSGLFYRSSRLVQNGIRPVYVFDGKPPDFKKAEQARRSKVKQEAMEKWQKALEMEKHAEAKKYAQGTSKLTSGMVEESKELLSAMGIPYIQAPSEGEAQASVMVQNGVAYAAASQDYDALLFGSPVLLRNISITGRRKVPRQDRYIVVHPEEVKLRETLDSLKLSREKLIYIGILLGTDFNEGVKGVGPKTAIKIMKEVDTLGQMKNYVKEKYSYEFETDPQQIVDFFLKPPYAEVSEKFSWGNVDSGALKQLLVEKHDFSEERVEKTASDMLASFKEKGAQRRLEQFF